MSSIFVFAAMILMLFPASFVEANTLSPTQDVPAIVKADSPPEKNISDVEQSIAETQAKPKHRDSVMENLMHGPLSPIEAKGKKLNDEKMRKRIDPLQLNNTFKDILEPKPLNDVLDELSHLGEPAAVIVPELREPDIQSLLKIKQEVGITVLYGQIVLFTSGKPEGLRVIRPGSSLLEESTFLARTAPDSVEGPTQEDYELADYDFEYLIMQNEEVIEYDKLGKMRQEQPITYLLRKLNDAVTATPLVPSSDSLTAATKFIRHVTLLTDYSDYSAGLERANLRRVFQSDWETQSDLYAVSQDLAARYFELWNVHASMKSEHALDLYNANADYINWVDRHQDDIQLLMNSDAFFRNAVLDIIFFRTSLAHRQHD